jgi:hypothetical protein
VIDNCAAAASILYMIFVRSVRDSGLGSLSCTFNTNKLNSN